MDFKLYTNALKAYTADNGDLHVRGTTSSTIRDLHGDEMTFAALKSMEETAKQNMTVFLNHNYNVPDDLFGSVTDARIVKRFDETLGQEVYDLDIDVRVVGEDENPLAMKTYRAIKRGVKLGLSIGARVDKVSKRKNTDGEETYVIDSVRLLESSVVGIPANQRSYLQSALKSLRSNGVGELIENAAPSEIREGNFVSWDSSGGMARGRVEHVMRSGVLGVPDSDFKINATPEDPACLIRIWSKGADGWAETDKLVGHKCSTLRKIDSLKSFDDLVVKAVEVEGQPSADKAALIACLQQYHADNIAFYLEAHGAHWNVVGEDFTEYHELFEEIYEDAQEAIDPIAELLRKLNAPSLADIREVAAKAVGETVADDNDPESFAEAVYAANEALLDQIVSCINEATKINQQGVLNFLAERQDMHQKWSWQLRASLAPEEAEPEPAETPEVPGDMPEQQDAYKAGMHWVVGAARDLPIAETGRAWDGAAAKARIFSWAGFDGDKPDAAMAAKAFLVHDAAAPDLKGSYKLPFADVVDGSLKVIPSGLRAAASRLPNTGAPQEVLDKARAVIDAYEAKMGKKSEEVEVTKASKIEMGNYVSWTQVEGADGVGEVEQVVEEGVVTVPPGKETVASKSGDPAVLVRVWVPQPDGSHKPSNDFMGFNASQLKVAPDLEKKPGKKKPDATTVPGLEITNPEEEKKSVEDLEQKKTRVTVTVSTEGDGAAVAAQPAPEAAPETETKPEEVLASADKACDCAEGECACGAEIVEKGIEVTPAPTPAPAPAPEPAPAPAPAEAPKVAEAAKPASDKDNVSPRFKSGVSDQVLTGINDILSNLTDEDRDAVLAGLGVKKDGEPVVEAPISESDVAVVAAEDVAAEPAVEAVSAETAAAEAATSLEEVAAIAKSALDAAIAAQQEVVAVKAGLTELSAEKAKVEGELAKAMDLVGRMINIPMGRKQAISTSAKSTNGEMAPWLDPFIARLLDAQE